MSSAGSITVETWVAQLCEHVTRGDAEAVANLFHDSGSWRDLVAFGWTVATHEGPDAIRYLIEKRGPTAISDISVTPGLQDNEAFLSFASPTGLVDGYARLSDGRCTTLLTLLRELAGHPEAAGKHRRSGVIDDSDGRNWKDLRQEAAARLGIDEQPQVLIIGGGQAGLALGARLKALDVPTLIVDRFARVGDQWRSRYRSLTLHDPVWYDHLPYLPFPENWPIYTPKDKMGDWLALYAQAMELDIWNSAELLEASFDAEGERWTAHIRRGDERRIVYPAELVLAIGNAGFPITPVIAGADSFEGRQYHSSDHPGGADLAGQRVAVIGANNSAHDIASDLVLHGARPTMVQRTSTLVVQQSTLFELLTKPLYSQDAVDSGMTTERADLISLSVPFRLLEQVQPPVWAAIAENDRSFYDDLRAVNFALDFAEDGAGLMLKYYRSASGYYLDVGASQMVIDGRIGIRSGVEIERMDGHGLVFSDGTRLDAETIIYATGFGSMEERVERLFGREVAKKIGRCWGYGSGYKGDPGPWCGEIRNMWKPTAQEGLWFMAGNLYQCRIFSRVLAQQLKARYEGLDVDVIEPRFEHITL